MVMAERFANAFEIELALLALGVFTVASEQHDGEALEPHLHPEERLLTLKRQREASAL